MTCDLSLFSGSDCRELEQVTVGITHLHISFSPLTLRRTVDLDLQAAQLCCRSIEVRDFKFDVKLALQIGKQPKSALTQTQESESGWHVEENRRTR